MVLANTALGAQEKKQFSLICPPPPSRVDKIKLQYSFVWFSFKKQT